RRPPLDELARDELVEPVRRCVTYARGRHGWVAGRHPRGAERARAAAEKRSYPVDPERLAVDARRTQNAACLRLEGIEARLDHREDGVGQRVALSLRDGSDELLEIERVAVRALHDELECRPVHCLPERGMDDALACARRETCKPDHRQRALLPEVGELGEDG